MLRECTVPTSLGTVRWLWYIRAVHCEWFMYISAVHCKLILVYQCCPPRVDNGISMLPTWVTWWWRPARMTSQDCRTEISAHTPSYFSTFDNRQSLSAPPTPGFGSHQLPTPKTTSTLHETVPTIPPDINPEHSSLSSTWPRSISTFTLDCWILPTGLGWHTKTWGTNHRALLTKLLMTNHNLLTTSRPHQFIKCNVSLPSIFPHADETVVSTQIRRDKTHNMVRLQNSFPNKDNETDNSNLKTHTKITSMQQDCHNPQTPKKAKKKKKKHPHTHTHTHKETTKSQGEKATSPSIIHTPEETTGRRSWNHWMEARHLERQPDPAWTWVHNSRISQHLTAPHWAWKDGHGNEKGMKWRIWEEDEDGDGNVRMKLGLMSLGWFGISFASNTYTLHRLSWVSKSQLELCFHGHHQGPCDCRHLLGRLAQFVLYLLEVLRYFPALCI